MATVTIYGCSDDLVKVEGDLDEEFNPDERDGKTEMMLAFGDGTIIDVTYDDFGIWRITRGIAGSAFFEKDEDPGDDENRYSDRVTLTGDLRWVVTGERVVVNKIAGTSA